MPLPRSQLVLPKPPSAGTLRSYGLTAADWNRMAIQQGCVCPVCRQPFGDRKLVVDHEHGGGFKATKKVRAKKAKGEDGKRKLVRVRAMPHEERARRVRGILHRWCNGYVRGWLTLERAESIVAYLKEHESRKGSM